MTATVIDKDDKASMEKAEEEHLASMYEKEEATTKLPPPPKKTKRTQRRVKEHKTRTPHRKLTTTVQVSEKLNVFRVSYVYFRVKE